MDGMIPAHWDILSIKRIANMKSGDSLLSENFNEYGDYPVYGGNGLRGYTDGYTHEGYYPIVGRQGALCGNSYCRLS